MYLLFTTPSCPRCPQAKSFLEQQALDDLQIVDASTSEGFAMAKAYDVLHVPAVVEVDDQGGVLSVCSGLPGIINSFSRSSW